MKKLLLLGAAVMGISAVHAQVSEGHQLFTPTVPSSDFVREQGNIAMKASGASDTGYFTYTSFLPKGYTNLYYRTVFDSAYSSPVDVALPLDSGYIYGTNRNLNRGYAEKFQFKYKSDTSLRVLGVLAVFAGRVQPTSTKVITIALFRRGAQTPFGTTKTYNSGLPTTTLVSVNVPATKLGMNIAAGVDSFKSFYFPSNYNLTTADSTFFVGYTMPAYTYSTLANDTFGVFSSGPGKGFGIGYTLTSGATPDTVYTNQNVFMNNAGAWNDVDGVYGYVRNLSMVPIVKLVGSKFNVGVGFTHNDLTLLGAFPNPTSVQSTLRFSLKSRTDVTVMLSDVSGRTIRSEKHSGMTMGEHEIPVQVSDLAGGNYLVMIQTSAGDAIATQITVTK